MAHNNRSFSLYDMCTAILCYDFSGVVSGAAGTAGFAVVFSPGFDGPTNQRAARLGAVSAETVVVLLISFTLAELETYGVEHTIIPT